FAADDDPGFPETVRAANRRQIPAQRLHSRSFVQFSDLRFHRRRASHSAIAVLAKRFDAETVGAHRIRLKRFYEVVLNGYDPVIPVRAIFGDRTAGERPVGFSSSP